MTEKKPNTKRNLFENKKIVLLVSFLAAIIFWMVITVTESSDSKNTISGITITVPTENSAVSELGLDVISDLTDIKAAVSVTGPAYVVSSLSIDDFTVSASLSNVTTAGSYELKLNATKRTTSVSGEYEIISITPSVINVTFDYIDTKQFTVIPKANGASAVEGLTAEDAIVASSNYSLLSVKGARTEIEKIDKVVATAEVNSILEKTENFKANVYLYDAEGNELSKDKYTIMGADGQTVSDIEITVPIFKRKIVELKAQFTNTPEKYASNPISYNLSEATVLISGPPETIDSITSISLSEIDFDNISEENNSFEAALILPDGIKCPDNIDSVKVTITGLDDFITKTYTVTTITPTSSSNGSVSLTRNIRNVKIMGPKSVMNKLSSSDLYAELDISGKQTGQHTVNARIRCKSSNEVWQVGTYTASVNIK